MKPNALILFDANNITISPNKILIGEHICRSIDIKSAFVKHNDRCAFYSVLLAVLGGWLAIEVSEWGIWLIILAMVNFLFQSPVYILVIEFTQGGSTEWVTTNKSLAETVCSLLNHIAR